MADTVITTPGVARESDSSAMGWAVALILLLGLILFGIFIWPGVNTSNTVPTTGTNPSSVDVNVKLPEGIVPNTENMNNSSGTQVPTQQVPAQPGGAQTQ